jgi:hypothetical protein
MFNIKQVLLASATFGVVATIGAMSPQSAQSAIVGGQVSGIWTFQNDGPGGYQVGDPFTALYTYDDANIVTTINSSSTTTSDIDGSYRDNRNSQNRSVPLLSLVVNSGNVSQVFDFLRGFAFFNWADAQTEEQRITGGITTVNTTSRYQAQIFYNSYVSNDAYIADGFDARRDTFLTNGVSAYDDSFASASLVDYPPFNIDINFLPMPVTLLYASTDQPVTFSATDVPTPALLPGLIGLGLGALRKRKALAAAEQAA